MGVKDELLEMLTTPSPSKECLDSGCLFNRKGVSGIDDLTLETCRECLKEIIAKGEYRKDVRVLFEEELKKRGYTDEDVLNAIAFVESHLSGDKDYLDLILNRYCEILLQCPIESVRCYMKNGKAFALRLHLEM